MYESTFTFDYDKDVSGSNAMPQAPSFKPPSPPVSQDGLDEGNSSFKFDTASILGASTSSLSGAPLFANAPAYSLPPATSTSTAPGLATTSFDDPLFLGAFSASPSSGISSSQSPLAPGPSPGTSADLFMAYRDPLAELGTQPAPLSTFSDFDALFAATPMPPASSASGARSLASSTSAMTNTAPTSPEDPLAAYLNASPSPLGGGPPSASSAGAAPSPGSSFFTGGLAPKVGSASVSPSAAPGTRAYEAGCPLLTGGDKYEFDVDGLCSECVPLPPFRRPRRPTESLTDRPLSSPRRMKLKATCQEAARQALKSAMAEDAAASRKAYPSQL